MTFILWGVLLKFIPPKMALRANFNCFFHKLAISKLTRTVERKEQPRPSSEQKVQHLKRG
jgi:hypothetical protein